MAGLTLISAGCGETAEPPVGPPDYRGATASFLSDNILQVVADMGAGATDEMLRAYADCAAAEAMALPGVGYARHVRTLTSEEAGIRRADAVYTVTNLRPEDGVFLDRDTTRTACAEQGIPGV